MRDVNYVRVSSVRVIAAIWAVLGVTLWAGPARAQCTPQWQPLDASTAIFPGVDGPSGGWVFATMVWDPDGAGPITPKLVVGGTFTLAGNAVAANIATYDPATGNWSAVGSGVSSTVYALAVLPSGDLIAGGDFTAAGGVAASGIARWNGSSWSALGSGVTGGNSSVFALSVRPGGELVAGGSFTTAGGVAASNIARWNGSSWSALGSGMNATVFALAMLPSGDLVAGGNFTVAGGVSASHLARWNGSSWSALGSGVSGASLADLNVRALAVLPSGDLVAGGDFTFAGGVRVNRIARWNGSSWSALGSGMSQAFTSSQVTAFAVLPSGDLVAGGFFSTAGGVSTSNIARWNGSSWSALGLGVDQFVRAFAVLPSGDLVAGGFFSASGSVATPRLARYSGVVPALVVQPLPQSILVGQTLVISATVVPTATGVSFQWRRNGLAIRFNGPGGASPGGGTVSGAFGFLPSPAAGTPTTLTITNARASDSGQYSAVFNNACGTATSVGALVTVTCRADFDRSGTLDVSDIFAFLSAWFANGPRSDFDRSGTRDVADIFAFLSAWFAGC